MKKIWLLVCALCVVSISLSACYVVPMRDRDGGGYHEDREHHRDDDRREDRDRNR